MVRVPLGGIIWLAGTAKGHGHGRENLGSIDWIPIVAKQKIRACQNHGLSKIWACQSWGKKLKYVFTWFGAKTYK